MILGKKLACERTGSICLESALSEQNFSEKPGPFSYVPLSATAVPILYKAVDVVSLLTAHERLHP